MRKFGVSSHAHGASIVVPRHVHVPITETLDLRQTPMNRPNTCPRQPLVALALSLTGALVFIAITASRANAAQIPVAAQPPARSDTGRTATVTGTVYDSVAHMPLGDAQVQFVDAETRTKQYTVNADSLGRFRIGAIPPGKYIAGFFHSSVDVLGIESPLRAVTIADGAANVVALGIPGPSRVMATLCGARAVRDSTSAMAGMVRDAETGATIAGANVVVTWLEVLLKNGQLISQERRVPVRTDADGGYRMCGLPGGDTLFANAEIAGRQTGIITIATAPARMLRRDFTVGDSASAISVALDSTDGAAVRNETTVMRGASSLAGVVHGLDGKPLQGARIIVRGTGLEALTGSEGRFAIGGLPAGTFSVDAQSIGLEPRIVAVDLSTGTPAFIDVLLNKPVQELSRVVIVGRAPKNRPEVEEFLQRKKSGMGHYITAGDIALQHAFAVSDALGTTPGVTVRPSGRFGHSIFMRDGCPATIYLDGIRMSENWETVDDIPPNQVAGIEIYPGPLEAPPQYPSTRCGVILVWRKR